MTTRRSRRYFKFQKAYDQWNKSGLPISFWEYLSDNQRPLLKDAHRKVDPFELVFFNGVTLPDNFLSDLLVKKEVRFPIRLIDPQSPETMSHMHNMIHNGRVLYIASVDPVSIIPMSIPPSGIKHLDFQVKQNTSITESVHLINEWKDRFRSSVLSVGGNIEPFFTPKERIQFFLDIDASDIHDDEILRLLDAQCDLAMCEQLEEQLEKDLCGDTTYPLPFMTPMLLSPYCKTYEEAAALITPFFLGDVRDRHPVTMERLDDE